MTNPLDQDDRGTGSPQAALAPPVVASMVVYQPGPWFRESVEALASQTYPELHTLFFLVGDEDVPNHDFGSDLTEFISSQLPQAVIRRVSGNPGYATVANEVSRLVEGDGGFFCLMHDDVALEPEAIERLVQEVFRSNAGVVGPKLVEWDDSTILQSVGLSVDRIGEIDSYIGINEKDQEQHDSVRDVFALSSACLLIRSDLFRELGGFDRQINFFGEDIDLCWRVHLSGARVLIVPAAKARHRNDIDTRTSVLSKHSLQARHRVRTVVALSGRWQLPFTVAQMLLIACGQVVTSAFGGGLKRASAAFRASLGVVVDIPYLIKRRGEIRPHRRVAASEIQALQVSGSTRMSSYIRRRGRRIQQAAFSERDSKEAVRHQRLVSYVSLAVVAFVLLGSRSFFIHGVSTVGEFLPLQNSSESPSALVASFMSGWTSGGFGTAGSNPTGMLIAAVAGTVFLGQLGALKTMLIVGSVVVGVAGMWKIPAGHFSLRARTVGMVMYAALPLPYMAMSKGRLSVLVVYAVLPWVLRICVRAEYQLRGAKKTQLFAIAVLVVAVVVAFVPPFAALLIWVVALWVIGGLCANVSLRASKNIVQLLGVMLVGAVVLNAPWSSEFINAQWLRQLVGTQAESSREVGIIQLARFDEGYLRIGAVALGLYLPVFVSVIVTRSATFVWAARSLVLVVGTGVLMVAVDANVINIPSPDFGLLLVVVGCGAALGSAALASFVFDDDLAAGYRWWRPVVALSIAAASVGALPVLFMSVDGAWGQSETTASDLYVQMQENPAEGDYNVVFVGDRLTLPLPGEKLTGVLAFAVADDGELTFKDRWSNKSPLNDSVHDALLAVVERQTVRSGRLLAPLAIRYLVVPIIDGAESTLEQPIPAPTGLLAALASQLDFQRVYQASDLVIYENAAWLPALSILDPQTAELSRQAGNEVLLAAPLGAALPIARIGDIGSQTVDVQPSTLHAAVPFSERLYLEVNGDRVNSRVAFGGTTAFDIPNAGVARLAFDTPITRYVFVFLQVGLWLLVMIAMFDIGRFKRRILLAQLRQEVVIEGSDVGPPLAFHGTPKP